MSETVLRCSPETRARSAREIGCRVRIWLKMRLRLICRGILFEALSLLVKENCDVGILALSICELPQGATNRDLGHPMLMLQTFG